jgi:hypothetical protein
MMSLAQHAAPLVLAFLASWAVAYARERRSFIEMVTEPGTAFAILLMLPALEALAHVLRWAFPN